MDAWTLSQKQSLLVASNWGKEWTLDELNFVTATMMDKVADVADVLERTVYSISNLRGRLLEGFEFTGGKSRQKPVAEVAVCSTCWMQVPLAGPCC